MNNDTIRPLPSIPCGQNENTDNRSVCLACKHNQWRTFTFLLQLCNLIILMNCHKYSSFLLLSPWRTCTYLFWCVFCRFKMEIDSPFEGKIISPDSCGQLWEAMENLRATGLSWAKSYRLSNKRTFRKDSTVALAHPPDDGHGVADEPQIFNGSSHCEEDSLESHWSRKGLCWKHQKDAGMPLRKIPLFNHSKSRSLWQKMKALPSFLSSPSVSAFFLLLVCTHGDHWTVLAELSTRLLQRFSVPWHQVMLQPKVPVQSHATWELHWIRRSQENWILTEAEIMATYLGGWWDWEDLNTQ